MPTSCAPLTLLSGGVTSQPPPPAVARPGDSVLVVDAVLTVQVGCRRGASAVTLIPGDDGHWLGRIGSSRDALTGEVLSVDTLLDTVLQRAVSHPKRASDSRRRV